MHYFMYIIVRWYFVYYSWLATDKDKGVHAKKQDNENKNKNLTTENSIRSSKLVQEIIENTDDIDDERY